MEIGKIMETECYRHIKVYILKLVVINNVKEKNILAYRMVMVMLGNVFVEVIGIE